MGAKREHIGGIDKQLPRTKRTGGPGKEPTQTHKIRAERISSLCMKSKNLRGERKKGGKEIFSDRYGDGDCRGAKGTCAKLFPEEEKGQRRL